MLAIRGGVICLTLFGLCLVNPAWGEVCDKGQELASMAWMFALPFYALLVLLLWQAWAHQSRILHLLAAALTGGLLYLVTHDWWQGGHFHELAVAEGCREFSYVWTAIWGLLFVWSLWHILRPSLRRIRQEPLSGPVERVQ